MQLSQETIQETLNEIQKELHCTSVEHTGGAQFRIHADWWNEYDFSNARRLGLDIQSVMSHYQGKRTILGVTGDYHGIEVDVEYIGKHKIVMG